MSVSEPRAVSGSCSGPEQTALLEKMGTDGAEEKVIGVNLSAGQSPRPRDDDRAGEFEVVLLIGR